MSLLDNINMLEGNKSQRRNSKVPVIQNRQSMKLEVQNTFKNLPQTAKGRGQSFNFDGNSFEDNILN